ncbi:MAG TPA: UDP-glucose 4-epimerase GalE [Bacteroidales bacterium]|nr:UDP-glucose 4-epimerase GalE [Bacteroidales bacterium]
MKQKILVTGGSGYIGSHTVVELQKQGYEVLIADNLSNSTEEIPDRIRQITGVRPGFEKIDLSEREAVRDFFQRNQGIGAIIHFAALKAVHDSVAHPILYYRNNVGSTINLLENMTRLQIPYLVFSSSCTVYGQPDQLPVSETAPVKKYASPYGNTKRICEEIINDTCQVYMANAIHLRYFNPIGAHESALIGELPLGVPNNLMPFITQTAIGKREYLNVWGNNYHTPDGTAIRDYIHVVDLAKAHIIALERLMSRKNKTKTEVFNLGTGTGYSVMEVIRSFEKVSGLKLNYKIRDRRPGDVEQVWADTTLANRELGWKAEKGLDDMTLSAWRWEQGIEHGLKSKL